MHTDVEEIRRQRSERHHWRIVALPRNSGSRWEQDRDYKQDGQTPLRGIAAAVVVYATLHDDSQGSFPWNSVSEILIKSSFEASTSKQTTYLKVDFHILD
ncbi:hypothetical protein AVEN_268835-1 [Araneus ventricosus]|uniref:Uncharacterized protein n=1 Tax=Araneus ventricosus TaxID=182803 RepID=A0A4Y2L9B5_ARAVE|nr:hypothetical protein AVEN_268835-1 [Araneus ventricosus]